MTRCYLTMILSDRSISVGLCVFRMLSYTSTYSFPILGLDIFPRVTLICVTLTVIHPPQSLRLLSTQA